MMHKRIDAAKRRKHVAVSLGVHQIIDRGIHVHGHTQIGQTCGRTDSIGIGDDDFRLLDRVLHRAFQLVTGLPGHACARELHTRIRLVLIIPASTEEACDGRYQQHADPR